MAEEIVACPGCGKKFKIPEGAPGGTFQCTACSASVPYGKAAKGAVKPAVKGAAKSAAPARGAAPAPKAGKAAGAARHGHAAHAKRHGREEPADQGEEEERPARGHGGKEKAKRDQQLVLWIGIAGVVVVGIGAVVLMNKKKEHEPVPVVAPPAATQPVATPAPVVAPAPAPVAGVGTPAAGAGGSAAKPDETSGIGGTKTSVPSSSWSMATAGSELFVTIADIAGVTPQERDAMDKDVGLFVDFDSGKAGVDARNRLKKLGRKAVPPLLSYFKVCWNGKKWDDDKEKQGTYQVQQLLVEIVKADRPGGDFVARYDPRVAVPQKDFDRAARMWTVWWNNTGKDIEKFKDFAE